MPHKYALEDAEAVEEERRLAYVAITRAQRQLYMTYARKRTQFGETKQGKPSRFLRDIPDSLKENVFDV